MYKQVKAPTNPQQLLGFVALERDIAAGMKLDPEHEKEREDAFNMWNACVSPNLALGDGTTNQANFINYKNSNALPTFVSHADMGEESVTLHPDIKPLVGKFRLHHGVGDLHVDRNNLRDVLARLQTSRGGAGVNANRAVYVYKVVYAFMPCGVLKGTELVDAPGTGDTTPLHVRHLSEQCEEASNIVLVVPQNLKQGASDTLVRIYELGLLQNWFAGRVQLTVVHNLEKGATPDVDYFRNEETYQSVLQDEEDALNHTVDALVGALIQRQEVIQDDGSKVQISIAGDMTKKDVESKVRAEIRILTAYLYSYARCCAWLTRLLPVQPN